MKWIKRQAESRTKTWSRQRGKGVAGREAGREVDKETGGEPDKDVEQADCRQRGRTRSG